MAAIIYCWQQQHVRGRTAQLSDIPSGATCVADLDSRALALTKEASGNSRGVHMSVHCLFTYWFYLPCLTPIPLVRTSCLIQVVSSLQCCLPLSRSPQSPALTTSPCCKRRWWCSERSDEVTKVKGQRPRTTFT